MAKRFLGERIEPVFEKTPLHPKKPGCPAGFLWRGSSFSISASLSEWHDYTRRGRMERNIRPSHIKNALRFGSIGSGRDFFRVRTTDTRVFVIYYDRTVKDVNHADGEWYVLEEEIADAV
jgi:hypothetical protein